MDWSSGDPPDPPEDSPDPPGDSSTSSQSKISRPKPPLSPKVFDRLTKKSQSTFSSILTKVPEESSSQYSLADVALLSREINSVIDIFKDDSELFAEASCASQTVSTLLSRLSENSQSPNNKPQRKKISHTYSIGDCGPFMVIVESKANDNIGNMHPMNFGKELVRLKVPGVKDVNKKGKKRISVEFTNPLSANEFLSKNPFINDPNIDVFVPSRMVSSRGVIRDVGSDITEDDILNHSHSRIKIIGARQLNRRVTREGVTSYIPSNSWVLTFHGKILPEKIGIFGVIRHVNLYVGPVIQCYNCLRYGHTKVNCNSPKESSKCRNCGEKHDESECPNTSNPKCFFCHGDHAATDRKCPEYSRQKQINNLIALENISYFEAMKLVPKSYADNLPDKEAVNPVTRPSSFPPLVRQEKRYNSPQDATLISVQNRNSLLQPSHPRTSYSTQLKRRKLPQSPGYNREAHNNQLLHLSLPLSPIPSEKSNLPTIPSQKSNLPTIPSRSLPKISLSDEDLFKILAQRISNNFDSELVKSLMNFLTNNQPSTSSSQLPQNINKSVNPVPTVPNK